MENITITFTSGETKQFPKNTKISEVAEYYQPKMHLSILGARLNNKIRPMNYQIKKDEKIEFLDITNPYGYRMYQGGLKFIYEVAIKEVYPNCEVRFWHSVPKGIMTEIVGDFNIIKDDLLKIKNTMQKIIDANLPIEKINVLTEDALKYFDYNKQNEKYKNIHNTNDEIITLYRLKNYFNYYYTDLPDTTKKIDKFDLVYLGKNKIVLVYPNSTESYAVPEYVHYDNIIETFEKGEEWLQLMHVPYLSDVNDRISSNKIQSLIKSNELIFNESIYKAAEMIKNKRDVKVVLISGPSSTGKTTTTQRLTSYLETFGYDPIAISVDDYFKEREDTPKLEDGTYDFESLNAIDLDMFNKDLNALINGQEIRLPRYNFITGKKESQEKTSFLKENGIILIEGLHCLNNELTPEIENKYKFKIYLSPFIPLAIDRHNYISTVDLRLIRRMVRDNRTRGANISDTIGQWQKVRSGEEKYIFPYIHQADIIINTAYIFEVGVLKVYAEPLLYSVPTDSPYYEEARRLLKSLKNFYPIPGEYVSKDSILREFIG